MNDTDRMDNARKHYEAATSLHRSNVLEEAERHYRAVLQAYPGHSGALHGVGLICIQSNRLEDAEDSLRLAVKAAPGDGTIRGHLGLALLRLGSYAEAAQAFEAALTVRADDTTALMGLGDTLSILGRPAEAQDAFEKLLAIDPKHAAAHFGLGTILKQQGRFGDARLAYERAVALSPKNPAFHRALAEAGRFAEGDPRLVALEELARDENTLAESQKVELNFALAKAYDDLKRYEHAFSHLQKGNAIKRRLVTYHEAKVMEAFREIAAAFTPALMDAKRAAGHPSEVPVFIVGMPRSGTSLVEQILASHPNVFGAGELMFVQDLITGGHAGTNYPANIASLSDNMHRQFGASYLTRVHALAPDAECIVDKLPANFRHIGLIHLTLPNARIIHVRRDAVDTCFSCYSKLFLSGLNYTYDLGELGRYYKAYETLMAHWRTVLPERAMIDVQYETLIENFSDEARWIVAFCGLEWDERCLRFHETKRAVRTLSEFQVRQPLFKTSIGRWRIYEEKLKPLLDALH